ncbi:hypothetical protein KY284_007082 [Solanum tuberosum]|nr:hypothetical protein KY284_007082 [Solanum tuberosum]
MEKIFVLHLTSLEQLSISSYKRGSLCRDVDLMEEIMEKRCKILKVLQLRDCMLMKELPFGIEHLRKLQSLVLQNISENMLMTVKLKDSINGDYWKIAHIPDVNVIDMYKSWKVEEESNSKF